MMLSNDYDPRDLESFVQDIFDVNQFKQAFVKVLKPEGKGFVKEMFEPYAYQNAWTNDDSPLKAAIKSRQVGFSFNEMLDAMHTSITTKNYKKLFTSITQDQADELLYIVKETINLMLPEYQIPLSKHGASLLEFKETQSRLIALPSSDAGPSNSLITLLTFISLPKVDTTLCTINSSYNADHLSCAKPAPAAGLQIKNVFFKDFLFTNSPDLSHGLKLFSYIFYYLSLFSYLFFCFCLTF